MNRAESLIGGVYGAWVVVKLAEPDAARHHRCLCRCRRCGFTQRVRRDDLLGGVARGHRNCPKRVWVYRKDLDAWVESDG